MQIFLSAAVQKTYRQTFYYGNTLEKKLERHWVALAIQSAQVLSLFRQQYGYLEQGL